MEEDKAILEDEILKYRDDVRMLEETVSVLETQATDYKQDILALKAKEDKLIANVRSEKDKFNKEMNHLRQELSSLRVEKRRFQRDISVSRADKSNTERAYNALKVQKDSLQGDVINYKQEEKRLQREITNLKNDRAKLEREVNTLKSENMKLKQDIILADRLKLDLKMLQRNEEKITSMFNFQKDRLVEQLASFKDKFSKMENDLNKFCLEKDKLTKQLKRYEQNTDRISGSTVRRSQSQPTKVSSTPEKGKIKSSASVQGALVRRSVHSGEVSEVEVKVLDLQRRLTLFMAEKDDIQKELTITKERNAKLTQELKSLEADTSSIQNLLTTLADEKESLQSKLNLAAETKEMIVKERDELKATVESAQKISDTLRSQVEELREKNRMLEVDHLTVRESLLVLQNETTILTSENKHIKLEFGKIDNELRSTKTLVGALRERLDDLKTKLKEAAVKEDNFKEMVITLVFHHVHLFGDSYLI